MTDQLAFDLTLPTEAGTVQQHAVVFTAAGGRDKGRQVYHTHPELQWYRDYLLTRQRYAGVPADARVVVRTVTCSEWEDVT